MDESKINVAIVNELGLHARAAALFVKEANKFDSEITVIKDGIRAEGKSIMSLMMLAAPKGSTLEIIAKGNDAAEAITILKTLVENKFGEDK
jgi:phosphocarrier protein